MGPKTGARMIGTPIALITRAMLRGPAALTRIDLADRQQHAAAEALQHARGDRATRAIQAKPQSAEPAVKSTSEMM